MNTFLVVALVCILLFVAQGAGLGATNCRPDDTSFYCVSSRLVMDLKNIIFIFMVLVMTWALLK
jgi:hypothetical protein